MFDQDNQGWTPPSPDGFTLCRGPDSDRTPYCDLPHSRDGFVSAPLPDPTPGEETRDDWPLDDRPGNDGDVDTQRSPPSASDDARAHVLIHRLMR